MTETSHMVTGVEMIWICRKTGSDKWNPATSAPTPKHISPKNCKTDSLTLIIYYLLAVKTKKNTCAKFNQRQS